MPLNSSAFQGESRVKLRSTGYLLGYAGLIPFVGLAAVTFFLPEPYPQYSISAQMAYAAVILSFLTGIHWGYGIQTGSAGRLLWSCFPALVAWMALLMPAEYGLIVLMLGLLLAWIAEKGCGWPSWYAKLRFQLSFIAVFSLFASWIARAM
ncbi:Protein of unknown function [Marinospirillum celere]|uniref:DUF3429 domain-containing protein n=1 Tax=Marinospirillum celere TaxID=1122252 RepID=A0A1I1FIN3_9GAMM|nr:DUF3429 domain-containing protein [Marinospirillum celere]SFB99131.1 Protein of unknown function [Marinospirillum celere]